MGYNYNFTETSNQPEIIFERMQILFDGMGYDFNRLESALYKSKSCYSEELGNVKINYQPTDDTRAAYRSEIETQIKEIEAQGNIVFRSLERELIRTPLEEYAPLLFIILAGVNKQSYHPKVQYQYKHPSKKQRKLIELIRDIMPYTHPIVYADKRQYGCIKINGIDIWLLERKETECLFQVLVEEYKKEGLDRRYPYGEKASPDLEHPFPITSSNLKKQLEGDNRGGKNQKHFIRDLIYRIHFLMHIKEWFDLDVDFLGYYSDNMELPSEESILQYPFERQEAALIGRLLFYYGLYGDGKNDGDDDTQRILSLIGKGKPNKAILDDLEQIHPSYIYAEQKLHEEEEGL